MRTIIIIILINFFFGGMKIIANEHYCIIEKEKCGVFLYNYEKEKEIKLLDFHGKGKQYLNSYEIKGNHFLLCITDRDFKPYGRRMCFEVDSFGNFQFLYKMQEIQKNFMIKETLFFKDGTKKLNEYKDPGFISSLGRHYKGGGTETRKISNVYVKIDQLVDGSLLVYRDGKLFYTLKNKAVFYNSKFGAGYYGPNLSFNGKKVVYGFEKQIIPMFYSKNFIEIMDIETKEQEVLYEGQVGRPTFSSDGFFVHCGSYMVKDNYYVIINLKTKEVRKIEANYLTWLE